MGVVDVVDELLLGQRIRPQTVQIKNVKHGKYAGRVVADVLVGGEKLSDMLIAEGLGRPYEGGRREGWCQ